MKLVRWYHHPRIFPWITQFTLLEWLALGVTAAYLLWLLWSQYAG